MINENYAGSEYIILIFLYTTAYFFGKISGTQFIFSKKTWTLNNIFILNIFKYRINYNIALKYGIEGAASATLISSIITSYIAFKLANKDVSIKFEFKKIFFY